MQKSPVATKANILLVVLCSLLHSAAIRTHAAEAPPKIKVLIVDGFSNHDWEQTTRLTRNILEGTGRFEVAVSTSPPTVESEGWETWRPRFADFDVAVLNCNSLGNRPTWPREVELALERYVREGGGLYILHSANNAFGHWKEYDRMIGLGWRKEDGGWAITVNDDGTLKRIPPGEGRGTYHGPRVDTVVQVLGSHPIHRDYPRRWKTPGLEVYKYARGPAENLTVISYAHDEETGLNWPLEWVMQYGSGRVYNSTFGHVWKDDDDPVTMRCVGIQTTLIRAVEWLATGAVTWPVPERFPSEHEFVVKPLVWNVWPGEAPGEIEKLSPEYDRTTPDGELVAGRRVTRLTNVSVPTLTISKPDPAIDTGTAVVIAPGGGHWILAMDLEGTEVAEWLNSLGVTAIVLKYRVPGGARKPEKKWLASVQDGQRAMSMIRGRASEIGIDPDKIGIIGFSAGGSPVKYAALTTKRLYEPVDAYDEISFRPDFAAPIYSGGLPEEAELTEDCPPMFMVIAHDDRRPVEMAEMYIALKKAGISAELHIYESGGHGYGLRRTERPVTSWHDRMEDWMRQLGLLHQ